MEKIKSKLIIGLLFSAFATLVNCIFQYYSDFLTLMSQNLRSIGFNFIIFSLIGYVVLGNVFWIKKES